MFLPESKEFFQKACVLGGQAFVVGAGLAVAGWQRLRWSASISKFAPIAANTSATNNKSSTSVTAQAIRRVISVVIARSSPSGRHGNIRQFMITTAVCINTPFKKPIARL